ncbi:HAD family hydrolase [Acinetobacter bereziniae]|uniref:HAD family hydrolase n=1 Tax=Acinetobacter bereziniae TaxID=106648 RepID=A0A8I1AMH7_ACIBZ|nr:HAD family hydrolase [Acinetobacter bereziniae]QQC83162.1 HAD family hydrolase [Acinetobacter bereziniae]QQC85114.1 HAD family hydrolase [Acinetobacter bereziniae]UUN96319.1 HAD family hydrolase [Acinetobacter bereziniae]UUN98268.1 HAD family hydrolase [Acinetobacter bereziniae]
MESFIKAGHMEPSVIIFDVFGTLVKIEKRRSPYRKLMKWLKENGRQPKPDDAKFIMSQNLSFTELIKLLGINIPEQLLQELAHDLDEEIQSIILYEDTLSTLEELKKLGFRLALCSNLAMPYGKVVSSFLPSLDAYAWSYEVGAIKPESQIYQYLIDKLQCHAKDILFIGDTILADYSGPNEFGMSARLIDRKNGQKLADVLNDIL